MNTHNICPVPDPNWEEIIKATLKEKGWQVEDVSEIEPGIFNVFEEGDDRAMWFAELDRDEKGWFVIVKQWDSPTEPKMVRLIPELVE